MLKMVKAIDRKKLWQKVNINALEYDKGVFIDKLHERIDMYKINFYDESDFIWYFTKEINRLIPKFNHFCYVKSLEYDPLNYNISETTTDISQIDKQAPDHTTIDDDNYWQTKSDNKQTIKNKHQSELKSSQAFLREEYAIYTDPYDMLENELKTKLFCLIY